MKALQYGYDEFQQGIDAIALQMESLDFKPDYIIGVVRGGAVPAVYLSYRLKVPVVLIQWSLRDKGLNYMGNQSVTYIGEDLQKGAKILLIDDIVDSGETVRQLIQDWQECSYGHMPMDNLRIASLFYNPQQNIAVDFFHRIIDRRQDDRFVVFPWEGSDDPN